MTNLLEELFKKIDEAGLKPAIGLRQQGKLETVEKMREEGKTWDEIGLAIGWAGTAVKEWYEMEKEE